jgi:hypothetical protein
MDQLVLLGRTMATYPTLPDNSCRGDIHRTLWISNWNFLA